MQARKFALAALALAMLLAACGPKGVAPTSPEDTPPNHYLRGMEAVDQGQTEEAGRRFTRALELDPAYVPAMAGLGLLLALEAGTTKDKDAGVALWMKAEAQLDRAGSKARDESQRYIARVTLLRAYTAARPKDWLVKAEEAYGKAILAAQGRTLDLPYYRGPEAASFFMGKGWLEMLDLSKAKAMFGAVLAAKPGRWHESANTLFTRVQKIEQAQKQYTLADVAKAIAVKDAVSRGDAAALLVSELDMDRLLSGADSAKPASATIPADVAGALFSQDIATVLKWNVRGLGPRFDQASKSYLFFPAEPVTRKEMALALEDLLIKATGDATLATKYFGSAQSPFPDVRPTDAYFNAAMNTVSRNLLDTGLSGRFEPDKALSGADLLLAVVRLRDAMNIH